MIIFDTSVIIELIRAKLIENLTIYKDIIKAELILPQEVLTELSDGNSNNESVKDSIFKSIDPEKQITDEIRFKYLGLGNGETSVLATALMLKKRPTSPPIIVMTDDSYARKVAEKLSLEIHGTLWLLHQFKIQNIVSKERIIHIVKELPSHGFYINDSILIKTLQSIEKDC